MFPKVPLRYNTHSFKETLEKKKEKEHHYG
jgi:hypothetical protein